MRATAARVGGGDGGNRVRGDLKNGDENCGDRRKLPKCSSDPGSNGLPLDPQLSKITLLWKPPA